MDPETFWYYPPPPTEFGSRKNFCYYPPPTESIRAKLGLPPPPNGCWPVRLCLNPPTFTRRRELWSRYHHLAPAVASLVGRSLCMLDESRSSWLEGIYHSTVLCEQLFAGIIHMLLAAGAIIRSTTNRYKGPRQSSMVVGFGVALKAQNSAVTPSSDFHVSHEVFLPRPPKHDTVSHPVKAWMKYKA